jgi:hypothetical protein
MRIAVCFSGQLRTGNHCYYGLKEFLGILYDSCDFFIHTWNINKQKCYNLSNVFSKENIVSNQELETLIKNYNPKKIIVEDYNEKYNTLTKYEDYLYADIKIFDVVQPLWYSFSESVKLKTEYELENGIKYDYVLKLRPDIKFHPHRRLSQDIEMYKNELESGEFYIENLPREWDENTHTIDDVYFLSNSKNMNTASEYYDSWIEWGVANRNKSFYGFTRHAVLNNLILSKFKRRDWGGESGYVVLRPECLQYKENTLNNYYECGACEDYYYGNPKNPSKFPAGYYIDLLKSKYIINDDTTYYVDELQKV